MNEKPVLGFEGLYTVDRFGNVYSLPRYGTGKFKRKMTWAPRPNGYYFVTLSMNNIQKRASVHRVVALAFLGEPDDSSKQVNHKNGDKSDNRVENLEWVTTSANQQHALANGMAPKGERSYRAIITEEQAKYVISSYAEGIKQVDIAKKLGVSKHLVNFIIRGRSWKHLSRPF